jgi:arginyl-tRNA synthetase
MDVPGLVNMKNQIITEYLTQLIKTCLEDERFTSLVDLDIALEHPANNKFGDYSTNIALQVFSKTTPTSLAQNPRQLAEVMVSQLNQQIAAEPDSLVAKVEVAGPGFINFYLSDKYLLDQLVQAAGGDLKITTGKWQKQKIMVEFTDPNPFKEFHIGHLYSNIVGESVCRILEKCGAEVKRADYFGDVGMHVAKSVWGLIKKLNLDLASLSSKLDEVALEKSCQQISQHIEILAAQPLSERVQLLGQAYALGATAYEEDDEAKQQIKEINFLTFLAGQKRLVDEEHWTAQVDYDQFLNQSRFAFKPINLLYQTGRSWSLSYFESIYQRVGMKFDFYFPESEAAEYGVKIVKDYLAKGVFKESQGAVIFPGSEYGLHDRVFLNSLGLPTYEAKELGLPLRKHERFAYDKSIIITGNEINEYFKVLLTALAQINPDLAQATTHIGHGMVRLPEGKMSSRTGKILTGEWLIEEAKKRIIDILAESRPETTEAERFLIAELVGLAAIKYAFLKGNVGGDISFSFDESLSLQGNSGPYLQYTYVRCWSVLQKAINLQIDALISNKSYLKYEANPMEKDLLRYLYQYSDVVLTAANDYSPHHIATYIYNLAQKFNTYYGQHRILDEGNNDKYSEQVQFRLLLTAAVGEIIKDGLMLLGIKTVEKM